MSDKIFSWPQRCQHWTLVLQFSLSLSLFLALVYYLSTKTQTSCWFSSTNNLLSFFLLYFLWFDLAISNEITTNELAPFLSHFWPENRTKLYQLKVGIKLHKLTDQAKLINNGSSQLACNWIKSFERRRKTWLLALERRRDIIIIVLVLVVWKGRQTSVGWL